MCPSLEGANNLLMRWSLSNRADPAACAIADRHYNRQKPGTPQFVPPGRCLVLKAEHAVWVTSWPFPEYVKHRWPGAWVNSLFRKEDEGRASDYIKDAVAATLAVWGAAPDLGLVTFVDQSKVRHKRDPGRSYLRAGFIRDGETRGGLLAFRLLPDDMPKPDPPIGFCPSFSFFGGEIVPADPDLLLEPAMRRISTMPCEERVKRP